jgi:hypothetical protein
MLTLKTKDGRLEFGPGDTIQGMAGWQLDVPPKKIQLFLMWYTMGKGDEDACVVEECEIVTRSSREEKPFSFDLPDRPYSFEGKLIALQWTLELVTHDPDEVHRLDFMVSPWVKQVELDKDDDDDD